MKKRQYLGNNMLLQGNTLELLPAVKSSSIDLVFADPPYFLSNGGKTCKGGKWVDVDKGAWDRSHGLSAMHEFNLSWLKECQRLLKTEGSLWVSGTQHVIYSLGYALQQLDWHLLNTVTWYKPNASPNFACRYFTHSCEMLIWASPKRMKPLRHKFNYHDMKEENEGKQMRDMWTIPSTPKSEKAYGVHPTQKPLKLLRRIVRASSNEGDLVLDPFCGSGTTGVACEELGRRFIGIDMDREYLRLARRRIECSG